MSAFTLTGRAATLALCGMLSASPVATALEAQEYANIQSQCRREAQDYGVAPEQIEEYVNGCVLAYGGMPAAAPEVESPPAEGGAEVPHVGEDGAVDVDAGEQDTGMAVE
jgi:hypothetical protein